MSRLEFATQSEAQACADSIHQRMAANFTAYARSVAAGQTLRWAIPYQDVDESGRPIGSNWYVNVKDRCDSVLTTQETSARTR